MNSLIRIGTVSRINVREATVDVVYSDSDDMVSSDLQVLNEHDMPKLDDMVLVVYLTQDPSSGFVIGTLRNKVSI